MTSPVRMSRARVLRSVNDLPLRRPAIEEVAPAIYATEPHSSRSRSYAYVPTFQVLETLQENGFGIYEVAQQRSRKEDKDPYTKHMIRLRNTAAVGAVRRVGGGVPEVVVVNAHDGTASYHLFGGFFRYICTNGLVAGSNMMSYRVRHTLPEVTRSEVLGASMDIVTKQFKDLMDRIEALSAVSLNRDAQMELARKALQLRYPDTNAPFTADNLLMRRRSEDESADAWTVLNMIQENVVQGGFETRSALFNRRSLVRPVERVTNQLRINRGLWDEVERLAGVA